MPCSNFQKKKKETKINQKQKSMFYLVFFQIKQNQTWMRFWDFAERIEKGTETILHNWWSLKKKTRFVCKLYVTCVGSRGFGKMALTGRSLGDKHVFSLECLCFSAICGEPEAFSVTKRSVKTLSRAHTHTQQCVQKHIIDQIKASRLTVSHKSWPQIRKDQFLFFFLFHSHFLKASTAFFSRPY